MPSRPIPAATRRFRPSLSGTLIAGTGVVILCGLGTWQVSRYHQMQALWDGYAAGSDQTIDLPRASTPPSRYVHARIKGRYLSERQFLLDSMPHEGEMGYRVLTPLEREHGETVLVDRGWVPRRSSGHTPDLTVTTDTVELTGRMDLPPGRGVDLKDTPSKDWPRLMNYPKMDDLERALGRPLYPQILLLDPTLPNGFVRDWQPPGFAPSRYLGYAITWFACALTLVGLYIQRSRRPVAR